MAAEKHGGAERKRERKGEQHAGPHRSPRKEEVVRH